jgi:drug/metabolite transporter (DMT)-like permease/proteasome lid subunit RPN8/RPN11
MTDTAPAVAHRERPVAVVVGLYILVCLIWGTTWLGIKYAVTDMPPTLAAGLRFLVGAPVLVGLCLVKKVPLLFPRRLVPFAVFVCLAYFCIPYLLLNVGEQYISSGLTAICFASVSVLIVLLSVPVLGASMRPGQMAGILVAFAALIVLVLTAEDVSFRSPWGVAAVLGAAFMHSFAYVWIKRLGGPVHVLTLNTVPMMTAGLMLTVVAVVRDTPSADMFTTRGVLATIYLGLVASALCFLAYFWLLQRLSALVMSFIFVIFPVLAQLFGVLFEGAGLSPTGFALTLVILGAFAWTLLGQRRPPSGARQPAGITREVSSPGGVSGDLPTPDHLRQIYAAALRAYPQEACGLVRSSGVQECVNAIETPGLGGVGRTAETGYAFAAGDLLMLGRSLDSDDPVRVIFHSHPDAGAYMSEEDQSHAVFGGQPTYPVDHLVVDATADGVRGARKFRFDASAGRYVESAVYGAPLPADGLAPQRPLMDSRTAADRA